MPSGGSPDLVAWHRTLTKEIVLALSSRLPLGGRTLARNTALNLLGHGLPLLIAIPTIPILIGGAGTERFGLLTIAWMLIGYVSLLDFGVGRALTHAVAERVGSGRHAEIAPVVRAGIWIAALISLATGTLLVLTASVLVRPLNLDVVLTDEAVWAVRVVGVALPFVVLSAVLRGVLEGMQRFVIVNIVRIPLGLGTFLAPVAVLPWTNHVGALVAALLAVRILGWAGYFLAVRRSIEEIVGPAAPDDASRSRTPARELLRYGGWATVSNLVSPIMVHFDRVLIGSLLTATAVAYYTTPFEIVTRLLFIPGAAVAVFFPAFAHGAAMERHTGAEGTSGSNELFRGSVAGILLLLLPPAFLLFGFAGEGLSLWLGEEFAREGTTVARWLLVGVVVNAVAHVPFVFIQGVGRPDVTAKIHLLEVPLYGATLFFVLPRWGIVGAAAVWTARVTLDLGLLLIASGFLARGLRGEAIRTGLLAAGAASIFALPLAFPSVVARAILVGAVGVLAAAAAGIWVIRVSDRST